MGNIAISVESLGKSYRIGHIAKRPENLREVVRSFAGAPFHYLRSRLREPTPDELIWALKDISFEVKHGEVIGIIGKNGAGKSTLLKILSRITEPSKGQAKVYGRVGSLLEVGTGFHPELTGRENIYLNGTILGMRRTEIDKRFDEIVNFSGIEKFIDTPVKRYSSGMYVRLAFAVAAHLEPEILLVDEVLAVGDVAFQKRCLQKMETITEEGRTIIFVSHNMYAVQELCTWGILLEQGNITSENSIQQVISQYLKQSNVSLRSSYKAKNEKELSVNDDKAQLLEADILNADGEACKYLRFGEPFTIRMLWKHHAPIPGGAYSLRIYDEQNRFLCAANTLKSKAFEEDKGIHHLSHNFTSNVLIPGEYYVAIGCSIRPHTRIHDVNPCLKLVIHDIPYNQGEPFTIVGNPIFAVSSCWEKL